MVDVVSQPLQKKPADGLDALSASAEAERLRLALLASAVASFDWTIADDRIQWDGAVDILPYHADLTRLPRGAAFNTWLSPDSRSRLAALVETRNAQLTPFEIALEAASALGSIWLTMVGVRYPRPDGRAEKLTGMLRVTTEKQREVQRLTYLATRDELTGHLNRNSLRAELTQAIDRARAEERHCAFLVAAIDRLAMINDGYGFDAGDEVIVASGERMARSLRSSDIIGRIAGNKFGVILRNCSEREIAIVADRLRSAIRSHVIDTRCGQVSATSSVGAVWLPSGAASSQEAMLRAEEALDRARRGGRDGYAVYEKSPQREGARLRLMQIADDVVAALNEGRLKLAYQPIIHARDRSVFKYECLLRMQRPDGSIATAGQFVPAAEQLGIVGLIDRRAIEIAIDTLRRNPFVRLGVNVSGTAAGELHRLCPRQQGGRRPPQHRADRDRGAASVRRERPVRQPAARARLHRRDRRFRRRLHLVPQPPDHASRHGQDRRRLHQRPVFLAREPGLRPHARRPRQELQFESRRRVGGVGRRRPAPRSHGRRLLPGLLLRRTGAGAGLAEGVRTRPQAGSSLFTDLLQPELVCRL
jgi:diguanylate cyclase (GGDEF)-like protein